MQRTSKCNDFFIPGKLSVLADSSAGSSGKGVVESYLLRNSTNCNFTVNTFMWNASHIVFEEDGREFCFKNLNSNAHRHDEFERTFIANGAVLNLKSFLKEIEDTGIPRKKIGISPLAAVSTDLDMDYEKGTIGFDGEPSDNKEGTIKHGSTCSGVGAVRARKALRNKHLVLAKDVPELKDMICNVQEEILMRLGRGESGLLSLAQGFQLSYGLPEFYPFTTSRNVTVAAGLDDCMLPVTVVGNVLLNCRAYPIRIASNKFISRAESVDSVSFADLSAAVGDIRWEGTDEEMTTKYKKMLFAFKKYSEELYDIDIDITNQALHVSSKAGLHLTKPQMDANPLIPFDKVDSPSGPGYDDQKEIAWEDVEEGYGKAIPDEIKNSSLTKLPRRVFTFSKKNLEQAIIYNQTHGKIWISCNFMNWVSGDMEGETEIVDGKSWKWLHENITPVIEKFNNVELRIIGTGKYTGERVFLD